MKSVANELVDLPNGRYKGTWSGMTVTVFLPDNSTLEFRTKEGIRGIKIPCKVTALDGNVTVESLA